MKAMVLAAGLGQRMRPLTLLCAKPVLPVLNRPLLAFTLEQLRLAGVREVVVNLHHLPDSVRDALGSGRHAGLRIRYAEEPEILGTGGGPRAVRAELGRQPFLLVNGDVLFDFDLAALAARHRAGAARATLALRPQPDARAYSSVVTDRGGRILSIAGLPRPAKGVVSMFAGVHVIDPALLDRLPAGRSEIVPALYGPLLAEGGRLAGVRCRGAWYDLGRPSLYRDAQLRLLSGRGGVVAARDARIAATAVARRSVIGARARVLTGARIEGSILWAGTVVDTGASVARSIVAAGGVVRAGERADNVIVLPAAALGRSPSRHVRRGDMAWVTIE